MIKFHPAVGGITVELVSEENGRTVSSREFVPFDEALQARRDILALLDEQFGLEAVDAKLESDAVALGLA